ncbi:NAD(P)/FAD-dependent oxidoreductase [Tellurirhabdus bombi]|uniref:NAD(P)/FAD-dependent oxidoreductase n=1 Tax=Tellurirhabdus bombi TaxID=2907205 RepID=UPI001F3A11E7|nr:FAD-dependent oxidoreductase [Tellurirhabdus bombi]
MLVRSSNTYWLEQNQTAAPYPTLHQHLECDVLIIGGGITGALVAYDLVRAGIDTVLIDKRGIGKGSTAASTALIQYEIDVPLHQLIDQIGEHDAVMSYKLCLNAIHKLAEIVGRLDTDCGFSYKKSLYYAAQPEHVEMLKKECAARTKYGFRCSWLNPLDIRKHFQFNAPGGILSEDAAELDAMELTRSLYRYLTKRGLRIFEQTSPEEIDYADKRVRVRTSQDTNIVAKKLIYATGYETQKMFEKDDVLRLKSTYALVTEPIAKLPDGLQKSLIWDTADPYFYARTASDGRMMLGGEDEWIVDATKRDALIPEKQAKLLNKFNSLFPELHAEPHLTWAGTFAETKDGLPYIGEHKRYPNSYFALGFGGNGITFSITAAGIIRDLFQKGQSNQADIFRFGR